MIAASTIVTGIRELATLAGGPVPRVGGAMSDLGRVDDAAIAIDGATIVWVGRRRRLAREVRARPRAPRVDLGGACVVPGFVDAHTHPLFAGERAHEVERKLAGADYATIAAEGGGIFSTVRATRAASSRELLDAAHRRLAGMAAAGTVAAEVKTGYALTVPGELALLRLVPRLARASGLTLVATCLAAHAVPPEYSGQADAYVDAIIGSVLPVVVREHLARFCDVFCEPGFFTVEQAERLLRAALRLGLEVKIHADEFVYTGGGKLAARLGARSAEHLLVAPAEDRTALAAAGVTAVLLPVTPFASLSPLRSPGREMVDAGVPVALGTDLSPNAWIESMPLVLTHAVYGARLTPAEALVAATVNAAHATGLPEGTAQLTAGRSADFVAFDTGSLEGIPYRFDASPTAIYRQGKPHFSR